MNEIMVSISCMVYNHEKYVRQALESFVNQKTNFKFEVLVHDDASTDNSAAIIREYEEKYPDIIKPIYQTENKLQQGIKVPWVYQYPKAQGKYIAICEGDDFFSDENKLQEQVDALENNPSAVICTARVQCVDESGHDIDFSYPAKDSSIKEGLIKSEDFMTMLIGYNKYPFQTSSYVIKTDFLKRITQELPEYFTLCPSGDVRIMWACALEGDLYFIDKIYSRYRRGVAGSWSSKNKSSDFVINHHNRLIAAYFALDEATKGKYHSQLEKNIHSLEMVIMKHEGGGKTLKDKLKLMIHNIKPTVYKIVKPIFKLIGRH